jgi:hypothetical protein
MSASVLINNTVDGPKIRQALLPATPVATPAVAGGNAKVGLDVPGYTSGGVFMLGTDSGDVGRVSLRSGGGKGVIGGGLDGSVVLGDATNTGTGKLSVNGTAGTSTVYNVKYDPLIKNWVGPYIGTLSYVGGPITYGQSFNTTGMYCLSVNFKIYNYTVIGNSVIDYYVENNFDKSIVPTTTNTITPDMLRTVAGSGGASAPLVFNYTHLAYLTASRTYDFIITAYDATLEGIEIEVYWSQMC